MVMQGSRLLSRKSVLAHMCRHVETPCLHKAGRLTDGECLRHDGDGDVAEELRLEEPREPVDRRALLRAEGQRPVSAHTYTHAHAHAHAQHVMPCRFHKLKG